MGNLRFRMVFIKFLMNGLHSALGRNGNNCFYNVSELLFAFSAPQAKNFNVFVFKNHIFYEKINEI